MAVSQLPPPLLESIHFLTVQGALNHPYGCHRSAVRGAFILIPLWCVYYIDDVVIVIVVAAIVAIIVGWCLIIIIL